MKRISYLFFFSVVLAGCNQGLFSVDESVLIKGTTPSGIFNPSEQPSIIPTSFEGSTLKDLEVYFTDPDALFQEDYSGGIDEYLVQAMDASKSSIDVAIYSINLWSICDALINAYQRGIQVRVVMESDNLEDEVPRQLKSAGITMIGDRREGLMHNKFVIIDKEEVWTGSANMTVGSFYYDNNNLVHLNSAEVAEDYITEFEEMYLRDMFGSDVVVETPHPQVQVGKDFIEVYFSPDDQISEKIKIIIEAAQESIYFMAFSFTSDSLGDAIVERFSSGLLVEGIMDGGQVASNNGTEFDLFQKAGINIIKTANEDLLHHKVIIIDQKIVITGSYNFSKNAEENNDENILFIHSQEIAKNYMDEYEKIKTNLSK